MYKDENVDVNEVRAKLINEIKEKIKNADEAKLKLVHTQLCNLNIN